MSDPHGPDEHVGSGHDRSARERDVLRELHELTDRPRAGQPPIRMREEPGSVPDPGNRAGNDDPRRDARCETGD
jgi:hypothetical protein